MTKGQSSLYFRSFSATFFRFNKYLITFFKLTWPPMWIIRLFFMSSVIVSTVVIIKAFGFTIYNLFYCHTVTANVTSTIWKFVLRHNGDKNYHVPNNITLYNYYCLFQGHCNLTLHLSLFFKEFIHLLLHHCIEMHAPLMARLYFRSNQTLS